MKPLSLFIAFLFSLAFYAQAQVNLVVNPSFEILIACPNSANQLDSADGWHKLLAGGGGTPDIFNICCTFPSVCGVPTQTMIHSSQYPHSGNGYSGMDVARSTELDNWREYIQTKLQKKLTANHIYCVTFYVSLAEISSAYITTLGAYLDNGNVSAPQPHGIASVMPQIYNITQPLMDSINWMKIEGSFTANGTEEYLTIGNFFTDNLSGIGVIGSPTYWTSYYYIDDVSVVEINLSAYAGNDTLVHNPGDSVFIGRPSEVGLDEDCIWFVDGIAIDTIAGLWVKPDSTTTYILEQTICGNVSHDTITVTVSGVGVDEYQNTNQWVKVYPNPSDGDITIQYKFLGTDKCEIVLYDVFGRKVYTQPLPSDATSVTLNAPSLPGGVYYYRATQAQKSIGKGKLVVIK